MMKKIMSKFSKYFNKKDKEISQFLSGDVLVRIHEGSFYIIEENSNPGAFKVVKLSFEEAKEIAKWILEIPNEDT